MVTWGGAARRDRYDPNGLDGQGFHAWFYANGTLRGGLDFLQRGADAASAVGG